MTSPMETVNYRLQIKYDDEESEKFKIEPGKKSYSQQYSHVYAARLKQVKEVLVEQCRNKWSNARIVDRIVSAAENSIVGGGGDNENDKSIPFVVIGTCFKEQARPNVLDEYRSEILHNEDDGEGMGEMVRVEERYQVGENDAIALEDESGRIRLAGTNICVERLVTGISIAVLGTLNDKGELEVVDFIGPGFPKKDLEQIEPPQSNKESCKKILLLSGLLDTGLSQNTPIDTKFTLLCDWLAGSIHSSPNLVSSISSCYIAGDLGGDLGSALERTNTSLLSTKGLKSSSNGHNARNFTQSKDSSSQQLRDADIALARLSALLPVILIPGQHEPTNISLPQQPLHPLLLPNASRYDTFHTTTNPHESMLDDSFFIVGHAGQPIIDMLQHANYSSDATAALDTRIFPGGDCICRDRKGDGPDDHFLAALEDTLYYRHLAPTAPDSLSSYPFAGSDPFVLDNDQPVPTVLFSGGASYFATSLATRQSDPSCGNTRIVALPSFAQTGIAIIVDLDTLQVEQLSFASTT